MISAASKDALHTAVGTVPDLARSGLARLRARRPLALILAGLWGFAIALDAITTWHMMSNGFEEANPVIAPLMAALGVPLSVVLVSAWTALLALVCLGRPRNLFAWVVTGGLLLVLVLKLLTGISNTTLYFWGFDFL